MKPPVRGVRPAARGAKRPVDGRKRDRRIGRGGRRMLIGLAAAAALLVTGLAAAAATGEAPGWIVGSLVGLGGMLSALLARLAYAAVPPPPPASRSLVFAEAAFKANPTAIAVRDGTGELVAVNRAWEALAMTTRDKVVGLPASRAMPFLEPLIAGDDPGPATGTPRQVRWLRADGSVLDVMACEASVKRDVRGGVLFVTTLFDVSDRQATENALAAGREQLDLVLRATHAGIWDADVTTGATYFSARFKNILGYADDADLNAAQVFEECLHPADRIRMVEAQHRHLQQNEPFDHEYRLCHASGGYRWVHGRGVTLRDPAGSPVRFLGSIIDISPRKDAERELRAREQHYRQLVETCESLIWALDVKGRFTFVNRRGARAVLGYEPEDMIGRHFIEFAAGADRNQDLITYEEVLHSAGVSTAETRWKHKAGHLVFLSVNVVVKRDLQGKAGGTLGTATDITDRVSRVKALEEAHRLATEAARAKSEFLATMSHEIRTPLNGVTATTTLLADTHLSTEQSEYVETIRTSGESLLHVINDILDFSKIEAGKMEIEAAPFAIERALDDALDILGERVRESGVELFYRIDADVPRILVGDLARLRQILLNLLSNAVKFTQQGEIEVSVAARAVSADVETPTRGEGDAGDLLLEVAVRDTGVGIPEDKLGRLFQAFTQADSSTTRRFGGTGLGLAISRRLAQMMGGDIVVDSTEGVGSRFTLTLRVRRAHATESEHPAVLRGKSALVVHPNAQARATFGAWCRDWGLDPSLATDADEADRLLRAGLLPTVVIIASADGVGDADTVAMRLRAAGLPAAVPLVLVSPRPRRHLGAGAEIFAHVLLRPVKPLALRDVLTRALGTETRAAVLPASEPAAAAQPLHGMRILVAEDHEINQRLAIRMLQKLGCVVTLATNGAEAVELAAREQFDLVLMDMQMPEMDGLEAARRIRASAGAESSIPIVAMTANAMKEDRDRCMAAGMNEFLTKPIDRVALTRTLSHYAASAGFRRTAVPDADGVQALVAARPTAGEAATEVPPGGRGTLTTDSPPVDPDRTSGGDSRPQLARAFASESGPNLAKMRAALDHDDYDALRAAAQEMKAAALGAGAARVVLAARALELPCRRRDRGETATRLDALSAALVAVIGEMESIAATAARESAVDRQPADPA